MTPEAQVLLSGALTFGVPLVLAARELVVLRRGRRGSWGPDDPGSARPKPLPRRDGPSQKTTPKPVQKQLPACLIPTLQPATRTPSRVLEDA